MLLLQRRNDPRFMPSFIVAALIAVGVIGLAAAFLAFGEGTGRWKSGAFIVFVLSLTFLAAALVLAYLRVGPFG